MLDFKDVDGNRKKWRVSHKVLSYVMTSHSKNTTSYQWLNKLPHWSWMYFKHIYNSGKMSYFFIKIKQFFFSLTTLHVWLQLTFLPLLCASYLHSITLSHLSFCFCMTFTNTLWFSLMHMLCTDISLQYFSSASKHLSLSPHLQFNFWGNSIIMVQILPDDFPFRFGFIVFILCFNNLIMRTLVFRTPNIVLYLIPFHSIEPRLASF